MSAQISALARNPHPGKPCSMALIQRLDQHQQTCNSDERKVLKQ